MKILIISGSHSRHLFVHQAILNSDLECAAIVMERESPLPRPPKGIRNEDRKNFIHHFVMESCIHYKYGSILTLNI